MFDQLLCNFKPVASYGYPHIVRDAIIQNEPYNNPPNYKHAGDEELSSAWNEVVDMATESFNYRQDNKTVIKLENSSGLVLYIGRYDERITIGLSFEKVMY